MLIVVSRDGVIEMINRYSAKLLDYTKSDLIGKNWFEMIVPASARASSLAAFEQMIAGLLNVWTTASTVALSSVVTAGKSPSYGKNALLREESAVASQA